MLLMRNTLLAMPSGRCKICGLAAFYRHPEGVSFLESAAQALQYRGYDSFGYAVKLDEVDEIQVAKSLLPLSFKRVGNWEATAGIYHNRWATHGKAGLVNSHPISSAHGYWYVVHNGIINNYKELNKKFGFRPNTETDTETIANLLEFFDNEPIFEMLKRIQGLLEGQYAFIAMNKNGLMVYIKNCTPLYISGDGRLIVSDPAVFHNFCYTYYDLPPECVGYAANREVLSVEGPVHEHYTPYIAENILTYVMESEIKEQVDANKQGSVDYRENLSANRIGKVGKAILFGCGSSYNAALLGKAYFERISGIQTDVRYSTELVTDPIFDGFYLGISQSGETKDTLSAFDKIIKKLPLELVWGLTNNEHSSMFNKINHQKNVLLMETGRETAVAATKTFTATVLKLFYLSKSFLGFAPKQENIGQAFKEVIQNQWSVAKHFAEMYSSYNHMLVLANGLNYPIARELALKIKEVSYIHSEAVYSAEIKHGPLALIDDKVLSIFLITKDDNLSSVVQNIEEVHARGGRTLVITDDTSSSLHEVADLYDVALPNVECVYLQPLVFNLFGQILALELALARGLNPDMPRNLAKSVTV
jgi:glucosamine--fructose-6-phosphate aminotransferase (isomerizing)